MILDDICDYLSSGNAGTPGVDLFAGYLPESSPTGVDVVAAVYETGGQRPEYAMGPGPNTAVVERPRVQVVCRAAEFDYASARARAHVIYKLLDGMPSRAVNGTAYKWASAVQAPFLMGRDQQGRVLIACNYDVVKDVSA